jgi:phospholipase A-2-activating protein
VERLGKSTKDRRTPVCLFLSFLGTENVQTISHPCTSVWSVAVLANGDIVSGGSDGVVRVFTVADDRAADAAAVQEYDEAVASHAIPS